MRHHNLKSRVRKVLLVAICLLAAIAFGIARPAMHRYRLWQARVAISNREPKRAIAWLEAAERSNQEDAEVDFLMARTHRHLDAYGTAMTYLTRAQRLGYPTEALDREKLLTMAESAQVALDDPRLGELMANPGDDIREIYEALVKGYYRLYELGPANLVLDTWEEDYPNDPQPRFYRGLLSEHDEKWSAAEKWFRQALALAPDRVDLRSHLAQAVGKQHRYREAILHYRRALRIEEDVNTLVGLGKCLQAKGALQEAREAFSHGLQLAPQDYDCLLALGEFDVDMGKGDDALRWLEPAASQKPRDYDVRYALAKALLYSGQGDRARPHFQFAARAQLALSQVKALREHVADYPEDAESRFQIGAALLEYGDQSEGMKWLHSVFKYRPDHPAAHAALATYYAEQGAVDPTAKRRLPGVGQE